MLLDWLQRAPLHSPVALPVVAHCLSGAKVGMDASVRVCACQPWKAHNKYAAPAQPLSTCSSTSILSKDSDFQLTKRLPKAPGVRLQGLGSSWVHSPTMSQALIKLGRSSYQGHSRQRYTFRALLAFMVMHIKYIIRCVRLWACDAHLQGT